MEPENPEYGSGSIQVLEGLAAVRKRNPATILYTVLLLAIVGAGVYFVGFAEKAKQANQGPQALHHAARHGSYRICHIRMLWDAQLGAQLRGRPR